MARVNTLIELDSIDAICEPDMQIEIQREIAYGGSPLFKLYVHQAGRTVIRIGKIRPEQFMIEGFRADDVVAGTQGDGEKLVLEILRKSGQPERIVREVATLLGIEEE